MKWGTSRDYSCQGNNTPFHLWFALWPVRLMDRRWAWLEDVERGGYFLKEVPVQVPFTLVRNWVYREAARQTGQGK